MLAVLGRLFTGLVIVLAGGCDYLFRLEHVYLDARVTSRPIPHVPEDGHRIGAGTLILGDVAIDTSAGTITPEQPLDAAIVPQEGGPAIMTIYAERIEIEGHVRVVGARALVLVAGDIHVATDAHLDASGDGMTAGAAAQPTSGRGGPGLKGNVDNDSGGGGGGHAGDAAPGGSVAGGCGDLAVTGGAAGSSVGVPELEILAGGGTGGTGARGACPMPTAGGGGGGAVQLSAFSTIVIEGVIDSGGGGGQGGITCPGNASAGGGGGAGGAIYLDAPTLTISGAIVANGGGGGGAGSSTSGSGTAGADATTTLAPAEGGLPGFGNNIGPGGRGAALGLPAEPGASVGCDGNGGGGGGATGRIVVRGTPVFTGISSPMYVTLPFP